MEQEGIELSVLNSGNRFTEIDAAIEQVAQAIPGANKILIGLFKKALELKLGEDVSRKCLAAIEEYFTDSDINEFYSSKNDQEFLMVNILKILPCFKEFERLNGLAKKHTTSSWPRRFFEKTPVDPKKEITRQFHLLLETGDKAQIAAFIKGHAVDLDAENERGETSLDVAVRLRNFKLVIFIGQQGALKLSTDSKFAMTEWIYETVHGNVAAVKEILNDASWSPATLLILGMAEKKLAYVKVAVEKAGADVNNVVENGVTPLVFAIGQNTDIAIVQYLLDAGARVNHAEGFFGMTPLHLAVHQGLVECAKLLLERGANLNVLDKKESAPIDLVRDRTSPMFDLLIEKGAKWPTDRHLAFLVMTARMLKEVVPEEGENAHMEALLHATYDKPTLTLEDLPEQPPRELMEAFENLLSGYQSVVKEFVKGFGKK
ncbi:MAG TPA: ankyrin repeat domain-containing protein [Gammaproteobacteria bacterium]|nr:ankyrin repeat domain-containing protein [Gammaproteobacteria bacterium]